MTERELVVGYLRKSAATLVASDIAKLDDPEDRREIECAARAIELVADDIEKGVHVG